MMLQLKYNLSSVVFDNADFDAESLVLKALPKLLSRNSNSLPIFKYLSQYSDDLPERISQVAQDRSSFDDLLSNTIKKNRNNSIYRNSTISVLRQHLSVSKCLEVIPHLKEENLDKSELKGFLRSILEENPLALSEGKSNEISNLKRVIRIYDWLEYHI